MISSKNKDRGRGGKGGRNGVHMDKNQRPLSREERVTSGSGKVGKQGSGLGSSKPHGEGRPSGSSPSPRPQGSSGGPTRRSSGSMGRLLPLIIVVVVVFMLMQRCSGGSSLGGFTSGDSGISESSSLWEDYKPSTASGSQSSSGTTASSSQNDSSGLSLYESTGGSYQTYEDNASVSLDSSVVPEARKKYTKLLGNGQDTVTLMIYMCGTDLESKYGMGTADMLEMTKANLSDNVNILVMTGGCSGWKNSFVSSSVNQIYRIRSGGAELLMDNAGTSAMTDPGNLAAFIQWCAQNYPASRYELIMWDHGGGTLSGYGYDEKQRSRASMTIDKIDTALKQGGVKFDFIGFDACLMATMETALTCEPYADYLIASEESEPGYGWYYTDWLNTLSANTSTDTTALGKQICDTFIKDNASKAGAQGMTLSVVDLAELATTTDRFDAFSQSLTTLIKSSNYKTVSNARSRAREFAASQGIDQIDLITFCNDVGTAEAKALAEALKGAVKYNLITRDMSGSQGLSIYFPYKRLNYLNVVLSTYDKIPVSQDYRQALTSFASLQTTGQIGAGGSTSPLDQFLNGYGSYSSSQSSSGSSSYGYSSYGSSNGSQEALMELMGLLFSGRSIARGQNINGLTSDNSAWLDASLMEENAAYVAENTVDTTGLKWSGSGDNKVLKLSQEQWDLIQNVELSLYYNDGDGYIDLGLDNLFSFNDDGDLMASWDGTWLALDGQIVPYYMISSVNTDEGYTITGRIPAILSEQETGEDIKVDVIVTFTSEEPYGTVLGARRVYDEETETLTEAKGLIELKAGDVLQPICDYYGLDGSFEDSYFFNDPITLSGDPQLSNVALDDPENVSACYRLTDIYNNHYWTPDVNS